MESKKRFPEGSVCKPCWELRYCPFGGLIEYFPAVYEGSDIATARENYQDALQKLMDGQTNSEDAVWDQIGRLFFCDPKVWAQLAQYDPNDVSCKIWGGHTCPVFLTQSRHTETIEGRRQSRYVPRYVMLKVVRRDNHICQKCLQYVRHDEIEFDHIIPHSKGGPTTVENIRLLCRACNREKSDSLEELLSK